MPSGVMPVPTMVEFFNERAAEGLYQNTNVGEKEVQYNLI